MENENDLCIVVHRAIAYVAHESPVICDTAIEGGDINVLAKDVLRGMRTHLSTPSIFASLRILRRLQEMVKDAAQAYEEGDVAFKAPKTKKCSVNYTMGSIYTTLVKRVYKKVGKSMGSDDLDSNPYEDISEYLDAIIGYIARKQFGINIK